MVRHGKAPEQPPPPPDNPAPSRPTGPISAITGKPVFDFPEVFDESSGKTATPSSAPSDPAATSFSKWITGPSSLLEPSSRTSDQPSSVAGPSTVPANPSATADRLRPLDIIDERIEATIKSNRRVDRILAAASVDEPVRGPIPAPQKEELPEIIDIPRLKIPPVTFPLGASPPPGGWGAGRRQLSSRSSRSRGSIQTFYGNSEARITEAALELPRNEEAVFLGETGGSRGSGLFCRVETPIRRRIIQEDPVMTCDLMLKRKQRCVYYLKRRDVRRMWKNIDMRDKEQLKRTFWKLRFIPSERDLDLYSLHRLRNFLLEYGFESTAAGQKRVLIFKLSSQVNHACPSCANAEFMVDSQTSIISVSVARELAVNEEVLFHYGRGKLPCCVCKDLTAREVVGSAVNMLYRESAKLFWHSDSELVDNVPNIQERGPRNLAREYIEAQKTVFKANVNTKKDRLKAFVGSTREKSTSVFSKSHLEQTFKSPQWARKLFKKDAVEVNVEAAESTEAVQPTEAGRTPGAQSESRPVTPLPSHPI